MNSKTSQNTNLDFAITGMTCASCVRRVEKAIHKVASVKDATVNLTTEQARVTLQAGQNQQTAITEIEAIVHKAGYEAQFLDPSKKSPSTTENQDHKEQFHLIMAALLSAPLLLSMIAGMIHHSWMLPGWVQFLLATSVQFWLGKNFYVAGYRALISGSGNMDLLVALGSTAAWGLSTCLLIGEFIGKYQGETTLYYESSSLIITFILFGHWLEKRARHKAASSIHALHSLRPDIAHRLINGETETVPLEQIKIGNELVIFPGERIPCDGFVIDGESAVDESMLTGESIPVEKKKDDPVTGGSLNENGRLVIRATKIGNETRLAAIVRLVESAQASKAPIQKLVDKISAVFVPIVILCAIITFICWWVNNTSLTIALLNAASVLVIACPCALGLATPTALATGCGAAARAGILIRDAEALENATHIQRVAFDKTGTLTEGHLSVATLTANNNYTEQYLLSLAASLSLSSEHPIAKALVKRAKQDNIPLTNPENFRVVKENGRGISGNINGDFYLFGNQILMNHLGINTHEINADLQEMTFSWLVQQKENMFHLVGGIAFSDTIRKGAKEAVQRLQQQHMDVILLTGDNQKVAQSIGKQLDIHDIRAELSPEDKHQLIVELGSKGKEGKAIAMVGDGINDTPAMASADLAIAVGEGTDAATEVAGVVLMRAHPGLVVDTFDIARKTRKRIQEGLFWAFIYNIIGIPLAALGYLSPAIAGGAMALSSVCVVTNALRLLNWKPKTQF